jgi:hypothetical protein
MRSKNRTWLTSFCLLASGLFLLVTPATRAQLQFSGPINYPVGTAPGPVALGDFNGDGKQDMAVLNLGSGNVSILLGNGDGTFRMRLISLPVARRLSEKEAVQKPVSS